MSLNLPSKHRPYRVIFADDDVDTLTMLALLGRHNGWQVDTAESAEELLEKAERRCVFSTQCYDIVVMDVSFFSDGQPGVSGIAAGRQLEQRFPNLPILFLTGYGGLLTRENIATIRNASYLEKPFDPTALVRRIEYLIRFTSCGNYEGEERRRTSINRSGFNRRGSDKALGVPRVLKLVMGV